MNFWVQTADDRSGIIVIDKELIRVDGTYNRGKVIPRAIPSILSAWSLVYPRLTSFIGIMTEIIGIRRLDTTLTIVIGKDDLTTGLK